MNLPGTVGVVDSIGGKLVDTELLDLDITAGGSDGNDGGLGTLGDNGDTGTLGVHLGEEGELLGDLDNILSTPLVALRVGKGLSLVADGVISVGENTVQLLLEELGDEGSGERKHEGLEELQCERV